MRLLTALIWTHLFFSCQAAAEIYKCEDAFGNVAFSQTPCVDSPSTVVDIDGPSAGSAQDCRVAGQFAAQTGRLMQAGQMSDAVFARYGGVDSLSPAAVSVINYVYGFRTSSDVSVERIAALSQAKCRARGFGNASCQAMPRTFVDSIGGCDGDKEAPLADAGLAPAEASGEPAPADANKVRRTTFVANENDAAAVAACKKRYRDEIDRIDAEMRRGYSSAQGEIYREKLINLTQQLRRC